jgi:hypothetical protein
MSKKWPTASAWTGVSGETSSTRYWLWRLLFPKGHRAFITISEQLGVPFNLLKEVQRINATQKERFLKGIRDCPVGLARQENRRLGARPSNPDTDDIRSSVAIELVAEMLREGAHVTAYDPKGMDKAREVKSIAGARLTVTALEAVEDAEALVIATEWAEFANVDLERVREKMHTPLIFDGRNLYDPETMRKLGFHYTSIGRPQDQVRPTNRGGVSFPACTPSRASRKLALPYAFQPLSRSRGARTLAPWHEFADKIVADIFARTSLGSSDRAFVLELFYGVLRNLSLLDFWIAKLRSEPVNSARADILRLGLYQVLLIETAAHAAVFETVELARLECAP